MRSRRKAVALQNVLEDARTYDLFAMASSRSKTDNGLVMTQTDKFGMFRTFLTVKNQR
jgi:hypothetical protein